MIKIDFHGSTHGHFLEYVSNVYIMQIDAGYSKLFTSSGAAHDVSELYRQNQLIYCGHLSKNYHQFDQDDLVVRISVDTHDDKLFFMALTNLMYRAGDVAFEQKMLSVPDYIKQDQRLCRQDWYSKFYERHIYFDAYKDFTKISNPVFNFPFAAFYSWPLFCKSLKEFSEFVNQSFFPNEELFTLWQTFMQKNQGWHSFNKCNELLEKIFANKPMIVDCNELEQGWINYNLSKMCGMYEGKVFEAQYPTNTQEIYQDVQQHLSKLKQGS